MSNAAMAAVYVRHETQYQHSLVGEHFFSEQRSMQL